MFIAGVVFDLGHTLMHLDGTWSEMFDRGVADLAAFLGGQSPGIDCEAFGQALLARRAEEYARAKETMRESTAEASMLWTFDRFGIPDPEPPLLMGAIDAFFAYEYEHWLPDPDALAVLKELSDRGLRLGLFSNATDDRFIQRLLDRFGFRAWLDPTLSSAGTGIRKPDPAALAPFMEAWDLPPNLLVMVGDTLNADILGAQRAGMHSVWFRSREDARQEGIGSGNLGPAEFVEPDGNIERLGELPDQLSRLESRLKGRTG